jgi:hypothetical protein
MDAQVPVGMEREQVGPGVLSQWVPQASSQEVLSSGAQESSLSQVPSQLKLAQSGQQMLPVTPVSPQHREPVGHSVREPPAEQSAEASFMQIPNTHMPG